MVDNRFKSGNAYYEHILMYKRIMNVKVLYGIYPALVSSAFKICV